MKNLYLFVFLCFSTITLSAQSLIHYWHFNSVNGIIETIPADFFSSTEAPLLIYEAAYPNVVNEGYMDDVAGTDINSRLSESAGNGIRTRNPSDSMHLIIELPTTGFDNIQLSYATQRSGSGMLKQVLYYTTDGTNYTQHGDTVFVTTAFELVSFDFTGLEDADDNPDFGVKILFYEQNVASNGNNRFDNVVLEGVALSNQVSGVFVSPNSLSLLAGETAQLTATVIPTSAINQQVIWESTDETVASVNEQGMVTANSPGNTAIIATTVDGGFSDTSLVEVSVQYSLTIAVSGIGSPVEGAEVSVNGQNEMTDSEGIVEFMLTPGNYTININAEQFFSESLELDLTSDTTLVFSLTPSEKVLVHYWHFNDLPSGIIESDRVPADISIYSAMIPEIIYQGPGEGYLDDYSAGTTIGSKQSTPSGKALRVRNPSDERELIIQLPTFNCANIELSYAVHRSGSGMLINHLEYTIDGENFINTGLIPNQINITEQYELHVFDFSDIAGVNDNPKFAVRITYEGNTMQSNGNNRYDNVAMIANLISSTDNILQNNAFSLFPNPSNGIINILFEEQEKAGTFSIFNMQGQLVQQGTLNGDQSVHAGENLANGMYIFQIDINGMGSNRLFMLAR